MSRIQNAQSKPSSFYSLASLPLRTQYLLTSHGEFFDCDDYASLSNNNSHLNNSSISSYCGTNGKKQQLKLNREIQVFLSLPFLHHFNNINNISSISDSYSSLLFKQNLKLIDSHLNSSDLYTQLRTYCAEKLNNCDLNVINLNYFLLENNNSSNNQHNSSCLAYNKYFRRHLGKAILSELLNVKLVNSSNHFYNYLPGHNLFEVR